MTWAGWLFVLGAPVLCAAAGAGLAWVILSRRHERQLDAEYEAGWYAGRDYAYLSAVPVDGAPGAAAAATAELPAPAPVADAETLAALPALHHEGGRHERPQRPAQSVDDLALIAGVRAEFDRIRIGLGLPLAS